MNASVTPLANKPPAKWTAVMVDLERPENRYLTTPLVRLITSGELPRPALKDYAVLRWPFQAHADPAMMLSHACFLSGHHVHHLLENVYDEIFRPKGEGDHPGLWVDFALRLGATQDELDSMTRLLVEYLGPVAKNIMIAHDAEHTAIDELATEISREIPKAEEREAFLKRWEGISGTRVDTTRISDTGTLAGGAGTASFDDELLEKMGADYAVYMGPMAARLVRKERRTPRSMSRARSAGTPSSSYR